MTVQYTSFWSICQVPWSSKKALSQGRQGSVSALISSRDRRLFLPSRSLFFSHSHNSDYQKLACCATGSNRRIFILFSSLIKVFKHSKKYLIYLCFSNYNFSATSFCPVSLVDCSNNQFDKFHMRMNKLLLISLAPRPPGNRD